MNRTISEAHALTYNARIQYRCTSKGQAKQKNELQLANYPNNLALWFLVYYATVRNAMKTNNNKRMICGRASEKGKIPAHLWLRYSYFKTHAHTATTAKTPLRTIINTLRFWVGAKSVSCWSNENNNSKYASQASKNEIDLFSLSQTRANTHAHPNRDTQQIEHVSPNRARRLEWNSRGPCIHIQ